MPYLYLIYFNISVFKPEPFDSSLCAKGPPSFWALLKNKADNISEEIIMN